MFHLGAFNLLTDPGNAFILLKAIREQQYTTIEEDFRVPASLPNFIGASALINDASGSRAQVQSPSLRAVAQVDIEPIVLATVFGSPPESIYHPSIAIPLIPDESVNFAVMSDPVAAQTHMGLVWFADGPQQPVEGKLFSVRAVSGAAQSNLAWNNANLTLDQVLPAGEYQVVGMRSRSTDGVASRLVFPNQVPRPGVPMVNAIGDRDLKAFRWGNSGVYGQFKETNPPTVDVFGGVAVIQIHILDLLRVG